MGLFGLLMLQEAGSGFGTEVNIMIAVTMAGIQSPLYPNKTAEKCSISLSAEIGMIKEPKFPSEYGKPTPILYPNSPPMQTKNQLIVKPKGINSVVIRGDK